MSTEAQMCKILSALDDASDKVSKLSNSPNKPAKVSAGAHRFERSFTGIVRRLKKTKLRKAKVSLPRTKKTKRITSPINSNCPNRSAVARRLATTTNRRLSTNSLI